MRDESVSITKAEYDRLKDYSKWLGCLEAAGVDDWEGYDMANQIYHGEIEEDEI